MASFEGSMICDTSRAYDLTISTRITNALSPFDYPKSDSLSSMELRHSGWRGMKIDGIEA